MNDTLEEEDMDDESNDNQPRTDVLGPSDADKNFMTQVRESIAEEMWAASGGS